MSYDVMILACMFLFTAVCLDLAYHKEKVQIQFPNRMCGVFIDRFGKDIIFHPTDEEHSVFSVDVNVSPQFFGWIFGLGKEVKVIGPESVVEQMRKTAEEFVKNYEK